MPRSEYYLWAPTRMLHDCLAIPEAGSDNPFTQISDIHYGLETFDHLRIDHLVPAAEHAVARWYAALQHVSNNPEPPTFNNTVLPLELASAGVHRVQQIINTFHRAGATEEIRKAFATIAALVQECENTIRLSQPLYERISLLHLGTRHPDGSIERAWMSEEEAWIVERMYLRHVTVGAGLDAAQRLQLHDIGLELERLRQEFGDNLESATKSGGFWVNSRQELAGLPESRIMTMRAAARDIDPQRYAAQHGGYWFDLRGHRNILDIEQMHNRPLREIVYTRGLQRAHDKNTLVASDVAKFRAQAARILGFETHLHRKAPELAVGTTEAILGLMQELVTPVMTRAREELGIIAERAAQDGITELHPWDVPYYVEVVRRERYHLDHEELMQHLELRNVVEYGLFYVAKQLYGLHFVRRMDLTAHYPDVRVYEVFEGTPGPKGAGIGLLLDDLYRREGATQSTWAYGLHTDISLLNTKPIAVLSSFLEIPTFGVPTLLNISEVTELFRAFGHVLHLLLGRSTYPSSRVLNLPVDYLTYGLQVNGMWAVWPEVMRNYGIHVETNELIPDYLIQQVNSSRAWGLGLETANTLAASLIDIAWHSLRADENGAVAGLPTTPAEVAEFEKRVLQGAGLDLPHLLAQPISHAFVHIFQYHDGGYFSYLWADCLEAQTVAWFATEGGLTRHNGERFRNAVLAPAATKRPLSGAAEIAGDIVSAGGFLLRHGFDRPLD